MFPVEFDYVAPASLQEAVALLREHGGDAKILAGGHSLIPTMKLRLAQFPLLVDIGRIPGLDRIERHGDHLHIGALVTQRQVETSALIGDLCPLMAETAGQVGDVQVRNRGTVGGTLAHGDPAADMPAALLALDGSVQVVGPNGERTIPASALFVDMMTTALEPDEVLTSATVPVLGPRTGSAYEKFANAASGYAIAGVAAVIGLDAGGLCTVARIAITGASSKATRATAVEVALLGKRLDDPTVAAAAVHAAEGLSLIGDIHADEAYRAGLARVLARRAVLKAAARAATRA